MFVLQFAAAA